MYADLSQPGLTEAAPVRALADPTTEEVGPQTYGALKALCEQAVEALMPGRTCIVRPGLLVGPHDPTGRFQCERPHQLNIKSNSRFRLVSIRL